LLEDSLSRLNSNCTFFSFFPKLGLYPAL
jgi:hypothetical protein